MTVTDWLRGCEKQSQASKAGELRMTKFREAKYFHSGIACAACGGMSGSVA